MKLRSVDPDGTIEKGIPADRVIGCVVFMSCRSIEPGYVQQVGGNKLTIGEPNNSDSERVRDLGKLLSDAGYEVAVSPSIQKEIWFKLLGNMTHNPVSAMTGATIDRILDDRLVSNFCVKAMAEAAKVGAKFGCPMTDSCEERNESARKLGKFKTSMLQDAEAKKGLELDALVGVVCEIGKNVGEPTPFIDALFGLARLFGRVQGLYPEDKGAK
jgi:2-dehydropantoate 2-reductase